jgi:hypothetical protein
MLAGLSTRASEYRSSGGDLASVRTEYSPAPDPDETAAPRKPACDIIIKFVYTSVHHVP